MEAKYLASTYLLDVGHLQLTYIFNNLIGLCHTGSDESYEKLRLENKSHVWYK